MANVEVSLVCGSQRQTHASLRSGRHLIGQAEAGSIAEFLVCGDSEAFSILGADEVQLRVPPLRVAPVGMTGLEGGSKVFARATV